MKEALVVGAGIAGASVAYFLAQAGVRVTVLDAGEHTASHVPSALINPVRGQSGQVDADAVEGMRLTWQLVRDLAARGHRIPHGQTGVLRPMPDEKTQAKFERHLPAELRREWLAPAQVEELAGDWAQVLRLPEAGWLSGPALCAALLAESGARRVQGIYEAASSEFASEKTFWCGGSYGSSLAGETRTHRMGSMLLLDRAPSPVPLSFGAYLSPDVRPDGSVGGVLGGTFETPRTHWQPPELPLGSLGWLLGKGAALSDLRGVRVTGRWTGSRLSGLRAGRAVVGHGHWELSGLSSKGFLLGPLLARRLVAEWSAGQ